MDATGQLKAQGPIPQALLESADARALYTAMLGKKISTKSTLQNLSGLSLARVNSALELLREAGLVTMPTNSWEAFKTTDIFGSRFG